MASYAERRDFPRIPVGPEYTAAFQVQGRAFTGVRLANLNPKGCFVILDAPGDGLITQATTLDRFVLEHPAFPPSPFTGIVMFALEHPHEDTEVASLGVGIRFLGVPDDVEAALHRFLEAALMEPDSR